jgi:hypothetical protein
MSTLSHYVTMQKVYVTATLPWKKQTEFLTLTSVAHGPDAIQVSPQLLAILSIPPNIGSHVIMVNTKNDAQITLSAAVKEWLQGDPNGMAHHFLSLHTNVSQSQGATG